MRRVVYPVQFFRPQDNQGKLEDLSARTILRRWRQVLDRERAEGVQSRVYIRGH